MRERDLGAARLGVDGQRRPGGEAQLVAARRERDAGRRAAGDAEAVRAGQQVAQLGEAAEELAARGVEQQIEAQDGLDLQRAVLRDERAGADRQDRRGEIGRLERVVVERRVHDQVRRRRPERDGPRHAQGLAARRGDHDRAGDAATTSGGVGLVTVTLTFRVSPTPSVSWYGATVNRSAAGVAARNGAERQRERPRRDVRDDDRLRRLPVRARSTGRTRAPSATRRPRRRRWLRDRGSPLPLAVIDVPGSAYPVSRLATAGAVERGPHLDEQRRRPRHRRRRAARAVHRPVERRAVGARPGSLVASATPGRDEVRLHAARRTRGPATRTRRPRRWPEFGCELDGADDDRRSRCPPAWRRASRGRARWARRRPGRRGRPRRGASRAAPTGRRAARPRRRRAPPRGPPTSGLSPLGVSAARPATRLTPFWSTKSREVAPSGRSIVRGSAAASFSACAGATEPASGTWPSKSTSMPRRSTTRTVAVCARPSVAPTARASGAAAGAPTEPYAGPAAPSFPAGATTSVFSSSAPWTARASGPSAKAA